MKNAKELRELTDTQRTKLLKKAKHIIFKNIELWADKGRSNYTLDINNVVYVEEEIWFKLEYSEFETIKNELKELGFMVKPSPNLSSSSVIISW